MGVSSVIIIIAIMIIIALFIIIYVHYLERKLKRKIKNIESDRNLYYEEKYNLIRGKKYSRNKIKEFNRLVKSFLKEYLGLEEELTFEEIKEKIKKNPLLREYCEKLIEINYKEEENKGETEKIIQDFSKILERVKLKNPPKKIKVYS